MRTRASSSLGYERTLVNAGNTTSNWAPQGELRSGGTFGRYSIVEVVGRGGMGVVYRARDTQLARTVALKLLRGVDARSQFASTHSRMTTAAERLVAEAQSLAKLDDPNVVAVFDTGEIDGQVFIAMQYIEGDDLARVLAHSRVGIAQLLAWFAAAGQGLAAAHAANLVHRDFKPSNVLIDRRGRALVTDFGLAQAADLDAETAMRGGFAGTPAYMAPEQYELKPATAASDQFAFCVAMWEALFGAHPYVAEAPGGMSPAAIGYAISELPLIPPPKRSRVPRRIAAALVRGVQRDPGERWPSMAELLAELVVPERSLRWPLALTALTLTVAATAYAAFRSDSSAEMPSCAAVAHARVAEVWPVSAPIAIDAAFAKTGLPFADVAAHYVGRALGDYATRWEGLDQNTCAVDRVLLGADSELAVRRHACLDGRLDALRSLVNATTTQPRPELLDHMREVVATLPELASCNDIAALEAAPGLPPPAIATEVRALSREVASANTALASGDYRTASAAAEHIVTRADVLQWVPLQVVAYRLRGDIKIPLYLPAKDDLLRSAALAMQDHLDRDAAMALTLVVDVAGRDRAADVYNEFEPLAAAAAERTNDRELIFGEELQRGLALGRVQRPNEGVAACRAAAEAARRAANVAEARQADVCLVNVFAVSGAFEELQGLLSSLLESSSRELGADHPEIAMLLEHRVTVELNHGQVAAARRDADRVLAIRRSALPAGHFWIAEGIELSGFVAEAEGDEPRARALFAQALAMTDESKAEQAFMIIGLCSALAMSEVRAPNEDLKRSIAHFERGLALARARYGPSSLELALFLVNYGQVRANEDVNAGLALLREARGILEQAHDPRLSVVLGAMATTASQNDLYTEARDYAEEALAAVTSVTQPDQIAFIKRALGVALLETHGDRTRAKQLVREARAIFVTLGPGNAASIRSIDKWLAAHR